MVEPGIDPGGDVPVPARLRLPKVSPLSDAKAAVPPRSDPSRDGSGLASGVPPRFIPPKAAVPPRSDESVDEGGDALNGAGAARRTCARSDESSRASRCSSPGPQSVPARDVSKWRRTEYAKPEKPPPPRFPSFSAGPCRCTTTIAGVAPAPAAAPGAGAAPISSSLVS